MKFTNCLQTLSGTWQTQEKYIPISKQLHSKNEIKKKGRVKNQEMSVCLFVRMTISSEVTVHHISFEHRVVNIC